MKAYEEHDDADRDMFTEHIERWRGVRDEIHEQVCREGFDAERGSFVQSYGSKSLDASCLRIPLVGFLPASDERVRGTVEAIERELMPDGLVLRYNTEDGSDGLKGSEGAFLPCSFWLVGCRYLLNREDEANALFEYLLTLRGPLGLLAEEYDVKRQRQCGNYPQAFTHLTMVQAAIILSGGDGPWSQRT